MIQGLSRLCAAPSEGLVMLASRLPVIVHCSTITFAEASEICRGGEPTLGGSLPWTMEPRDTSASDHPQQNQQHDRPHRRGDDGADPPDASDRRKTEHVPQPTADVTADDAHDDVANQAEAGALQDFPGQPTGDHANHQRGNQTLLHLDSLPPKQASADSPNMLTTQGVGIAAFLGSARLRARVRPPPTCLKLLLRNC